MSLLLSVNSQPAKKWSNAKGCVNCRVNHQSKYTSVLHSLTLWKVSTNLRYLYEWARYLGSLLKSCELITSFVDNRVINKSCFYQKINIIIIKYVIIPVVNLIKELEEFLTNLIFVILPLYKRFLWVFLRYNSLASGSGWFLILPQLPQNTTHFKRNLKKIFISLPFTKFQFKSGMSNSNPCAGRKMTFKEWKIISGPEFQFRSFFIPKSVSLSTFTV